MANLYILDNPSEELLEKLLNVFEVSMGDAFKRGEFGGGKASRSAMRDVLKTLTEEVEKPVL